MTIVIAAGGTGGHLYPAVALAREFLRRDPATRVLFVGTTRGLESKVLAHEGFELALISAKPIMGRGLIDMLGGVCAMPVSLWQCGRILRETRAHLVIGVGGYTSVAPHSALLFLVSCAGLLFVQSSHGVMAVFTLYILRAPRP